ncbi:MAG: recombinase family protein [Deltaproteobacteria bacterium]|nr:recombinase family protein [Deltaproteobacteria bacterium]
MNKKALIYCRVSTDEQAQEGFSLDAQERFCRDFANNNNLRIVGVYRDEGKSGTTLDRPALKDLLERCQQDKSIEAVIIQETDRLARNTQNHLTIKALLLKAEVKLISVAQPMLDDSPEGNMIDTILASVNQFQSDINSRKTKKGLKQKFQEGWWPGWAPLGYINVSLGGNPEGRRSRKIVKKDPQNWSILKTGFKLYLTGNYSVDEIGDILYKKGLRAKSGKKVPHSILFNTFRNPFYAGIMRWNGQEKVGKHQPMISLKEHQHILQIMDMHNLYACRRRKHSFLLRGFVFCNICGQRYTAEKHIGKNKDYYHCSAPKSKHSNRNQNVEVTELENQVKECFKKIQFSQEFVNRMVKKVKAFHSKTKENIGCRKQALYNQKMSLERKRDLAEEKLLNGIILNDDFIRIRDKIRENLDLLQDQINELEEQREHHIDVIENVLKLTKNIYKAYKEAPNELKRHYIGLFWEKFMVENRKIVKGVPTPLIQSLLQRKGVIIRSNWLPGPTAIITLEKIIENDQYLLLLKERLADLERCKNTLARAA